jgi:hypothetical protein
MKSGAQAVGFDRPDLGQESDVGEILHPRVLSLARQGVGMELLGDVNDARVHPMPRTPHADEVQEVAPVDHFRRLRQDVAEPDIQAERHAVRLPRELPLHAEPQALVNHTVTFDGGVVAIGLRNEREEVSEVETTRVP